LACNRSDRNVPVDGGDDRLGKALSGNAGTRSVTTHVLPLYPPGRTPQPLHNLYLAHRVHELGSPAAPFVYGNFVSSLDGRIAVHDSPDALQGLANPPDLRLFLELHAQADCLITHGGYLRALAAGTLGNVLQVNANVRTTDLAQWREHNDLPPQPAIVVASASLNFPIPASISEHGQQLYIATGSEADPQLVQALRERGYQVILAGGHRMVEGGALVRTLGELGYRSLYLLAGPAMLESMLRERRLSRLYLTMRHRLLGGKRFDTLIRGPRMAEAGELTLLDLYYDANEGQWFAQFEPQVQ